MADLFTLCPGLCYFLGLEAGRINREPTGPTHGEVACFVLGLLALALALVSPLCRLASTLASAHMVQHAILVAVAAPLLALGRTASTLACVLPGRWRRSIQPRARAGSIFAAAIVYGAAIWLWHLPSLYEGALQSRSVHLLAVFSLVAASLWFWQGIADACRSASESAWAAGIALLATMIHTGVLGALLTFSLRPWYPLLAARLEAAGWGLAPLDDQQLAGMIMWVPMGLIYFGAGIAVMAAWLSALSEAKATSPLPGFPKCHHPCASSSGARVLVWRRVRGDSRRARSRAVSQSRPAGAQSPRIETQ